MCRLQLCCVATTGVVIVVVYVVVVVVAIVAVNVVVAAVVVVVVVISAGCGGRARGVDVADAAAAAGHVDEHVLHVGVVLEGALEQQLLLVVVVVLVDEHDLRVALGRVRVGLLVVKEAAAALHLRLVVELRGLGGGGRGGHRCRGCVLLEQELDDYGLLVEEVLIEHVVGGELGGRHGCRRRRRRIDGARHVHGRRLGAAHAVRFLFREHCVVVVIVVSIDVATRIDTGIVVVAAVAAARAVNGQLVLGGRDWRRRGHRMMVHVNGD